MKKQTIAIDTPYVRPDAYGSLAVPVYHNVAFEFEDAQLMADAFCNRVKAPDYARVENPTVTNLEQRVRLLTGAAHVTAFNSGMAAISNTLLAVSAQGKNIVTSTHLFGNTLALVSNTLLRFGVKPRLRDLTNLQAVADAIDENTCCVFLEVVTNPQLEVADLRALADIAHQRGVPLIADSTVIPFTETHLKGLGVDIEVVSSTKYLSGGGTSLGGLVIDYGTFPLINQRIKYELLFNLGAYMTPQAAYLQTLGLETLDARYQRQAGNALQLAKALREPGCDPTGQLHRTGGQPIPRTRPASVWEDKWGDADHRPEEQGGVFPFPQPPDTHPPSLPISSTTARWRFIRQVPSSDSSPRSS